MAEALTLITYQRKLTEQSLRRISCVLLDEMTGIKSRTLKYTEKAAKDSI